MTITPASRSGLKIGLAVPHWEGISDTGAPTPRWREIQAMALAAEDAGVDSLWLCDHLEGLWEGWSPLAALAAVTQRVALGHIVMCTSFRNPALLAKMADTVDEISGGRLILGIGAGGVEYEHRAFMGTTLREVGRAADDAAAGQNLQRRLAADGATGTCSCACERVVKGSVVVIPAASSTPAA